MKTQVIAVSFLTALTLSAQSYAADNRVCLNMTATNGPGTGQKSAMNMSVIRRVGDEASVVGESCYDNPLEAGKQRCQPVMGVMAVDNDGDIEVNLFASEQIEGGQGVYFGTSASQYQINPTTMKGQGVEFTEYAVGETPSTYIFTYSVEVASCPTPDKEHSQIMRKFILKSDRL
jgi:hypothetical protein